MPLVIDKLTQECTQQLGRNVLHVTADAIQVRTRSITYLPEMAQENTSTDIDAITLKTDGRRLERVDILQHQMQADCVEEGQC